jgi:predicted HTH domain antitoxin
MASTLIENVSDILISSGVYPDIITLRNDSLRALFREKPELLRVIAIELYRKHEVSLSRAAEIAGLNIEDFKVVLRERSIFIEITPELIHEMDEDVETLIGGL